MGFLQAIFLNFGVTGIDLGDGFGPFWGHSHGLAVILGHFGTIQGHFGAIRGRFRGYEATVISFGARSGSPSLIWGHLGFFGVTFMDVGIIWGGLQKGRGLQRGVLGGRGGGGSQYLNQGESRRHSSKSSFTVMVGEGGGGPQKWGPPKLP